MLRSVLNRQLREYPFFLSISDDGPTPRVRKEKLIEADRDSTSRRLLLRFDQVTPEGPLMLAYAGYEIWVRVFNDPFSGRLSSRQSEPHYKVKGFIPENLDD